MGYEAFRDLPTEDVEIETPIETCKTPFISGKKLAVIPVLRAGLGMVNGILTLVPSAKVGHVGLYRDPVTHEPHEYYCKLPESINERINVIVDPMLATGGSAEAAVDYVKKQAAQHQIHVHHRSSGRTEETSRGTSGHSDLLWSSGSLPE